MGIAAWGISIIPSMNLIHTSLLATSRLPHADECNEYFGEGPMLRLFLCKGYIAKGMLELGIVYRHIYGEGNSRTYLIDRSRNADQVERMVSAAIESSASVVAFEGRNDFEIAPHIRSLLEVGIPIWVGLGDEFGREALENASIIYDRICNPPGTMATDHGVYALKFSDADAKLSRHPAGRQVSGSLRAMAMAL